MRTTRPRTLPLMLCLLATAWPAAAYEVAMTRDGLNELHWTTDVIPYSVHYRGAADVHEVLLQSALIAAFRSWGEVPSSSLQFQRVDLYSVAGSEADEINLLYWTEGMWPHEAEIIALTSINYYPDTGEIVDVDIDFNGSDFSWTVLDNDVQTDVQSIATHEIGHLFGLDHTGLPSAVMNPYYSPGETRQRTLQDDDMEGVSYLYPCEAADCTEAFVPAETGCSVGGPARALGWWCVGLLALGLALHRRAPAARLPLMIWAGLATTLPVAMPGASVVASGTLLHTFGVADAVVVARVDSVEPFLAADGRVHRHATLTVDRWLVGEGTTALDLDLVGGELVDLGTHVPGSPQLQPGQRLALALSPRIDGTPGLVGLSAGVVEIDPEGDTATWRPDGPGGEQHTVDLAALMGAISR